MNWHTYLNLFKNMSNLVNQYMDQGEEYTDYTGDNKYIIAAEAFETIRSIK